MPPPRKAATTRTTAGRATRSKSLTAQNLMSDNPTRPQVLAVAIAQKILEGTYRPGEGLREIRLTAAFEASRSSIREALRILERDGVVTITPRHGAAVTRLTTDELLEIYQVRCVLLGLAMALLCARREPADVKWLGDKLEAMASGSGRDARQQATRHAMLSADMARYVIERSGNALLAALLTRMSLQIARYTLLGLSSPVRRAESIASWRLALAAIEARDSGQAEQIGRKLVQDNLRFTIQQLAGLACPQLNA